MTKHFYHVCRSKRPHWSYDMDSSLFRATDNDTFEFLYTEESRQGCPMRRLLSAVLIRAIDDCLVRPMPKLFRSRKSEALKNVRKLRAPAWEWLTEPYTEKPEEFSAQWICEELDFPRKRIIEFVKRKRIALLDYTEALKKS